VGSWTCRRRALDAGVEVHRDVAATLRQVGGGEGVEAVGRAVQIGEQVLEDPGPVDRIDDLQHGLQA